MQWIFMVCIAIFLEFAQCHHTSRTLRTLPAVEWSKTHPHLVYPQLNSADSPRIKFSKPAVGLSVLVLRTAVETFYIELKSNEGLAKFQESATRETNSSNSCHYHGNVPSHAEGIAAISICEPRNRMTGTIMVRNDAYILRPLDHLEDLERYGHLRNASSYCGVDPHVISKVELPLTEHCGVEHDELYTHAEENEIHDRYRRSTAEGPKVIETAIYVDYPLYRKFVIERKRSEEELTDIVLAIINQVQIIYNYQSLKIKFKIAVVKLEFLTADKAAPDPAEGDIDEYLDNFCAWQSLENPPEPSEDHWDHALMLSGYDLHKVTDGKKNKKVLGLAWVNGMCRPRHSCTLNEGSSFEAAFVIAHEMGHSLGMMHDGRGNDCDPSAFLMAEKTGPGRVTWSTCSNDYLTKFFQKGRGRCLEEGDDFNLEERGQYRFHDLLPGQRFDLDDQCKLSLGKKYRPHLMPKTPFNNVCRELWCVSGLWASVAHPALEGSSCGFGKQCNQGKCKLQHSSLTAPEIGFSTETSKLEVQNMVADFLDKLKVALDILLP